MYNIIDSLKKVPEVHLRLVDLTWQLAEEDGTLDVKRLSFHIRELGEAIDEAKAYSAATRKAVWQLKSIVHL